MAARSVSRVLFASSSVVVFLSLLMLWQQFGFDCVRGWSLSLQGVFWLAVFVVAGVFTWKAMRAVRTFAETAGRDGLVVYTGYAHLVCACVPAVLVLFVSPQGWEIGYRVILALSLFVCGWQAARYNRGLQILRSLAVQIAFPVLFVFLSMFAAVHVSSEENRHEEEIQGYKDRGDMAGLRAYLARKEECEMRAARCGVACYSSLMGVFGLVSMRFLNSGIRGLLPERAAMSGLSFAASLLWMAAALVLAVLVF